MAVKTRNQLNTDNAALFVNNTTGDITPAEEKIYNQDVNDSAALLNDDNDFTGINTHTKEVRWHKGAGLTAAAALALGNTGNYHHVTGDTEIETLTTKQHGTRMLLYFDGKPNLKDSSNLLLGGLDIQTNAGSSAEFISEGSGVWRLINYKTGYQSSGTYSPTFADSTDMVTTLLSPMIYTSVGNIVTVYFNISIQLSNSETQGDTIFDVPILPANDFSDTNQAFGAITPVTYDSFTSMYVQSKGSYKTVQIAFGGATANSNVNLKGSFSYNLDN